MSPGIVPVVKGGKGCNSLGFIYLYREESGDGLVVERTRVNTWTEKFRAGQFRLPLLNNPQTDA